MKQEGAGLGYYLDVIRSRKWVIILAVFTITTAAIVSALLEKPVYEAEATVLLKSEAGISLFPQGLSISGSGSGSSLNTQMGLMKVRPIGEEVVRKLSLSLSPEVLLAKVDIEPESDSSIVHIKVQDGNPKLARDIANAVSAAYISRSKASSIAELEKVRKELFNKRRDVEEDIILLGEVVTKQRQDQKRAAKEEAAAAKRAKQPAPTSSPADTDLPEAIKAKLGMAGSLYTVLSEKYEELGITEAQKTGGAELASPAVTPTSPVRPKPISTGVIAFITSLMLGVSVAFVVEHLDNTIKTPEDVERDYNLPVLGQIPTRDKGNVNGQSKLVCETSPKSPAAEAFRALRTNVQYLNFDKSIRTLAVTSGIPDEGKTYIASNLGIVLAQVGSKVIVISADLRRPALHELFGGKENRGLSDVLAGYVSFEDVLQETSIKNFRFVTSGVVPPNPSELLSSHRMKQVLEQAKDLADIVILDTPPVLAVTDSTVIAPQVDGVMIVSNCGVATHEAASHIKSTLGNVGAHLLGVILNNVQPGAKHEYYYYQYEYSTAKKHKK